MASVSTGAVAGAIDNGVAVFRGVPFAAPPVGPLRWRPPQPPAEWQGVRDASRFGPAGLQGHPNGRTDVVPHGGAPEPTSEDCLTLNVWAPLPVAAGAPVMVFFHGGSGIFGSGALPYYSGAAFARDGVVLVTANYRLGALGGFAHPALTREARTTGDLMGAYAMMDQMAALRWVKRNIAAFGGDAGNVTIFGESAGAISVLNLLTAPVARDLFDKAIVQSGGGWFPAGQDRRRAEAAGVEIGRAFGVPADGSLAALREMPGQPLMDLNLPGAGFTDPRLAVEGVTSAIAAGRHARVPLMIGINSGEDSLIDHGGGVARLKADIKPRVMARLKTLYPGVDEEILVRNYFRDGVGAAAARWVARNWSARAPAYLYWFEHVDEAALAQRDRAPHGGEIFYVFETLGQQPAGIGAFPPTAADRKAAAEMHARWIAFARTGDPNGEGLAPWPACSRGRDAWMVFGQDGSGARDFLMRKPLDWYDRRTAPLLLMLRAQANWRRLLRWLAVLGRPQARRDTGGQTA
ncbi:MAG TPA: carboxylesterase family protein [Caulobacteraceae bacterium]|jgi:para-nitrobenzyl esterase|nr:carboxylesterase family protein [Caulobacteraceae bacterium]